MLSNDAEEGAPPKVKPVDTAPPADEVPVRPHCIILLVVYIPSVTVRMRVSLSCTFRVTAASAAVSYTHLTLPTTPYV